MSIHGYSIEGARYVYEKSPRIFTGRDGRITIEIIGYVPINGVDRSEYHDYVHKSFRIEDIMCDLANGNMPPGLVLQDKYGVMAYVTRDRCHLEKLELI